MVTTKERCGLFGFALWFGGLVGSNAAVALERMKGLLGMLGSAFPRFYVGSREFLMAR